MFGVLLTLGYWGSALKFIATAYAGAAALAAAYFLGTQSK